MDDTIIHIANLMMRSDVLLIAAGAGMGVDAGISDYYRGIEIAHPRLASLGLNLYQLSSHDLFLKNPALAWGHWITRQRDYLQKLPHKGYYLIRAWSQLKKFNVRIITTNLDRHFLRVGFSKDQVFEMHGSMYDAQCLRKCGRTPWTLNVDCLPSVDEQTMLVSDPLLPSCIGCGGPARVCTSLAMDGHWDAPDVELARVRHEIFFHTLPWTHTVTVLELGCGTVMNKLRKEAERIVLEHRSRGGRAIHVRINLFESVMDQDEDNISIPMGALETLQQIHTSLKKLQSLSNHE